MKIRNAAAFVAVTAVSALALSACAGGAPAEGEGTTTLTLVAADYGTGPENASQKYWESLADAFHEENPDITVDVETVAWTDFNTKIQTMVQNQQYPDLTEGSYFSEYAKQGILYPVSEVMDEETAANLLPVFNNLGTYEDVQYGMQFTTSAQTLFYNKKLFEEAGIEGPPETWADVEEAAKKITELGKVGLGLPLGPESAAGDSLMWFFGNEGEYQTEDGEWVINSPQNVETMEFLSDLVSKGYTQPNPATTNRTDVWQSFAEGNVGIINDGQGALLPIIEAAGVLGDDDWGTGQLIGKDEALTTTLGVADMMSAFKTDPEKQDAIREFLNFVYEDDNQIAFAREYNLLPATLSAAEALSTDPVFGPFLEALPNARQMPNDPAWLTVSGQMQNTLGTAVIQPPAPVLDALQQSALSAE